MADWWSMDKASQPSGMTASWETGPSFFWDRDVPTRILTCNILNIQTSIFFSAEASGRCWGFGKNSVVEKDIPETEVHQVIASWSATSQEGCHHRPCSQPASAMCSYNTDASDRRLPTAAQFPQHPCLILLDLAQRCHPSPFSLFDLLVSSACWPFEVEIALQLLPWW